MSKRQVQRVGYGTLIGDGFTYRGPQVALRNREGLTFKEFTAAANYGRPAHERWSDRQVLESAWTRGEDPTEWAAHLNALSSSSRPLLYVGLGLGAAALAAGAAYVLWPRSHYASTVVPAPAPLPVAAGAPATPPGPSGGAQAVQVVGQVAGALGQAFGGQGGGIGGITSSIGNAFGV